jgi:transcriptional regulator with XRE-family HTH domain
MGRKSYQRPSEVIGERVAAVRSRRSLSQRQLAELVGLRREVITQIELGKRRVTIDEWLAIARALNVAPMHLILPLQDEGKDRKPLEIAIGLEERPTLYPVTRIRDWLRGRRPLNAEASDRELLDWVAESPDSWIESLSRSLLTAGVDAVTLAFMDQDWLKERAGDIAFEIKDGAVLREAEPDVSTTKEENDV